MNNINRWQYIRKIFEMFENVVNVDANINNQTLSYRIYMHKDFNIIKVSDIII